jgi:Zn-dependent peptidase ImmA (M78 family)
LKSKKDTSIVMSGKTDSSVTNDAIESTAQHLRESLGLSDQSVFNIVELLENDMPKAIKGFRLQVVATCEAQEIYSTKVPPRIFATEHVYDLARRGDARSRVMIAHELAHLLLHEQSFNFRTLSQSSAANSTESEALKFALAFLIPSSVARGFNDPNLLSLYCKVDRKAAETRMRYVRENMEARDF